MKQIRLLKNSVWGVSLLSLHVSGKFCKKLGISTFCLNMKKCEKFNTPPFGPQKGGHNVKNQKRGFSSQNNLEYESWPFMSKIMPKQLLSNPKPTLKKSKKRLFWPQKLSNHGYQFWKNGVSFTQKSRF